MCVCVYICIYEHVHIYICMYFSVYIYIRFFGIGNSRLAAWFFDYIFVFGLYTLVYGVAQSAPGMFNIYVSVWFHVCMHQCGSGRNLRPSPFI